MNNPTRMTHLRFCLTTICAIILMVAAANSVGAAQPGANDLCRFLPNNGNSVYSAAGLLRHWPQDGPTQLWLADIGWGKSAVVEAAGRAFTATETDGKQWAVRLDPRTGKTLWKMQLYPKPNRHFAWGSSTVGSIHRTD